MAYVGTPIDTRNQFQSLQGKRFNGDGSTTDFTLDVAPSSTLDIEVFVGNVRQDPNSAYTLSGTTLSFTGAPPSGTNNIYVVHQAKAVGTINPGANTVGVTELNLSDGSSGQFIKTDGSGTLSFATVDTSSATDSFSITGSTPTLTIGDGGEEDTKIQFDGNAQDFYIGLDDSGDELQIGKGSTLGAGRELSFGASGPVFNEDSDTHDFRIETDDQTHGFFIHGNNNEVSINEDSPDSSKGGLTLNQGDDDGIIFAMKSSDINHGVTNHQETDTYMAMAKAHATNGGGSITGCSSGDNGMFIHGFAPSPSTTQNATGTSVVMMRANDLSGAGGANVADTGNCFGVQNGGNLRFIVRGDGNIYSDSSHNTYDAFEDAHLVRAFDLSHGKGVIDSKFDKFVSYNHEKLAELNLVGRENDGTPNHFINVTGMQRLHNGAIWQQYEKHQQLLEAVYDLAKEAVGEEKANAILEKHDVKRLQ